MSKKPWFDEYYKDKSRLNSWLPKKDILKDKWYHTIKFLNGSMSNGVYDMSCSLSNCFFEGISGKTVLDVGAADGYYSLEMKKLGADVTSLEVHPHLIRHIDYVMKSHDFEPKIIECDVFSQEFLDIEKKFDVMFCSHVLCHIMEKPELGIGKNQFIYIPENPVIMAGY